MSDSVGMTRRQIDELGERIAAHPLPAAADLDALELHLESRRRGLDEVVTILQGITGHRVTSRMKSVDTTAEKIRRDGLALSKIRDIAGARVVLPGGRAYQDRIVSRIEVAFPGAKVIDRRRDPSHGYRAVHLVVGSGTDRIEVQVRTGMQDQWAQIMERLADSWGRQMRYGGVPHDPERECLTGMTRRAMFELMMAASEAVDERERLELALERQRRPGLILPWRLVGYVRDASAVRQLRVRQGEFLQTIQSMATAATGL